MSCGYETTRADEIDKPGIITSQVIQHVVSDPLVIADLTERNPNVFYELAIRHAIRKPFVQLIAKGERIPFDVAGTRTVIVDHTDLDSVDQAKNEISNQIKAIESAPDELETPISVSIDLQSLRQSEKPEDRSLADLVAAVSEVRTSLSKLEGKLGTGEGESVLSEIHTAIRNLPRRLDDHFADGLANGYRRSQLDPRLVFEIVDMGFENSPNIGLLVVASYFREPLPWLYELGLEAYRAGNSGNRDAAASAIETFRRAVNLAFRGPWSREAFGRSKSMFALRQLEPALDMMIERALATFQRSGS